MSSFVSANVCDGIVSLDFVQDSSPRNFILLVGFSFVFPDMVICFCCSFVVELEFLYIISRRPTQCVGINNYFVIVV